jgi:hypothetical protein
MRTFAEHLQARDRPTGFDMAIGICMEIPVHCCDKLVRRSFTLVQAPNRLTAMQIASRPVQGLAAGISDFSELASGLLCKSKLLLAAP